MVKNGKRVIAINHVTFVQWITMVFFCIVFRPTIFTYNQTLRFYFNHIQFAFCVVVISLYLIYVFRSRKVTKKIVVIVFWQITYIISTYINDLSLDECIRSSLAILSIFMFVDMACRKAPRDMLKGLTWIVAIYVFFDIYYMMTTGSLGVFPEMNTITGTPVFFVNGKFQSCYLQLFFSIIAVINLEKKKNFKKYIVYAIIIGVNILVSIHVKCTTGTVILILFWLIAMVPYVRKLINTPWKFMLVILALNLAVVVFQVTLSSSLLKMLIEGVFRKQLTLTGRTDIYSTFWLVLRNHWILGCGYGNERMLNATGIYVNSQNAFLESLLGCGIVGTGCLIAILRRALTNVMHRDEWYISKTLISGIFAFFVAGVVEISFGTWFYLLLALMINFNDRFYRVPQEKKLYNQNLQMNVTPKV